MKLFNAVILESADNFIQKLDKKELKKVFFSIRNAENQINPKIFKKLRNEIWEFRVNFNNKQIRILAFWDKRDKTKTLVLASNGFYKKTLKTPEKEINTAERLRKQYFDHSK